MLDRHVVSIKSKQEGRKFLHAFFLFVMNTDSRVVGDLGPMGRILWQFQVSLNSYNVNSSNNDKNLREKRGMILLSSLMTNSSFDIEGG